MGALGALTPKVFESVGATQVLGNNSHNSIIFYKNSMKNFLNLVTPRQKTNTKHPQFEIPNRPLSMDEACRRFFEIGINSNITLQNTKTLIVLFYLQVPGVVLQNYKICK